MSYCICICINMEVVMIMLQRDIGSYENSNGKDVEAKNKFEMNMTNFIL